MSAKKPLTSIPLARVDGWSKPVPIYTAPEGRTILSLSSRAGDVTVLVTLDNGEVIRIETSAPRFTTVH